MSAMRGDVRAVTSTAGHEIVYDVQGDGDRAVILLCGGFMNRGRWREVGYVDQLASDYLVISIDPLGHGESAKPHAIEAYHPAELVDHTLVVMNQEGIDRAALWGYSRGGRLAWMMAEAQPERVELLVLGGTPVGVPVEIIAPPSQLEALGRGDWDIYWASFPAPLPEPVKQYMSTTNDPKAMAAALGAWALDSDPWNRPPVPAIGYLGDGEPQSVLVATLSHCASLGIPVAVLPTGGHAETFAETDIVLGATRPYLVR